MPNDKIKFTGARLKDETLSELKEMKDIFEKTTRTKLSMDDMIRKLMSYMAAAEPKIWNVYKTYREQQLALQGLMDEARAEAAENIHTDNSFSDQ